MSCAHRQSEVFSRPMQRCSRSLVLWLALLGAALPALAQEPAPGEATASPPSAVDAGPPAPEEPARPPEAEAPRETLESEALPPLEPVEPQEPVQAPRPPPALPRARPIPVAPEEPPETTGDAQDEAAESAAQESEQGAELPPAIAVTYHEQPSPLAFRLPAQGRSPAARAKSATSALSEALEQAADAKEPPLTSVTIEDGRAIVRVGQRIITNLYAADATAEGMSLVRYAEQVESGLRAFVPAQLRRKALQLLALHIFLSVFLCVIGFITLRGLRGAFDRWEGELDERRGSFKPLTLLRVPVFSGEALGGALAFGLAVGRVTAYVATVLATLVAVLSQFELTQPLLRRVVRWSAGPVFEGLEAIVTAIPGLILAGALLVGLRAGLRVLHVLLDGVSSKRIHWKRLPPERVSVFRFSAQAATVLLVAPLLVAAAFGRWGTPLETLALAAGGAVLLASVPLLASYVVGIVLVWRGGVRLGDWVQVGDVSGEVTGMSVSEISLVPESGGTISLPMLFLLLHPLRRLRQSPEVSFEVTVARDRGAKELIAALKRAVLAVESDARVELIDICHAWIKARVSAPAVRAGVRQNLLMAVADAVDRQEFQLPTLHGPDRLP
jgi:small-conductance mechanosensitive channel